MFNFFRIKLYICFEINLKITKMIKNLLLFATLALFSTNLFSTTDTIYANNYYYTPSSLNINVGAYNLKVDYGYANFDHLSDPKRFSIGLTI